MDENGRMKWKDDWIKCFLETCVEEVNRVGRLGGSLRKESWDKLRSKLEESCNIKTNQKQLKNQFDYLKQKYSAWVYLRNQTGNVVYDPQTNTFNISNEQWEALSKGHPKVKSLKTTPLLFPDLCMALFEGTSATGARSRASTCDRSRVASSSSFTSHVDPFELDEDDETDIVIACFAVHNFIRKEGLSDELFSAHEQNDEGDNEDGDAEEVQTHGSTSDQSFMASLREKIVTQLMTNGV